MSNQEPGTPDGADGQQRPGDPQPTDPPAGGTQPWPQQPPQQGWQQPGWPQQPPQQGWQQPGWQQQAQQGWERPGWPPPQPAPRPENKLGGATTALVLGLVALAGGVVCGLPLLVGPFAWVTGARARNEIDRYPGRWTNRSEATAGMVMGIVATVLVVLAVLLIALFLVIGFSGGFDDPGYDGGEWDSV